MSFDGVEIWFSWTGFKTVAKWLIDDWLMHSSPVTFLLFCTCQNIPSFLYSTESLPARLVGFKIAQHAATPSQTHSRQFTYRQHFCDWSLYWASSSPLWTSTRLLSWLQTGRYNRGLVCFIFTKWVICIYLCARALNTSTIAMTCRREMARQKSIYCIL